MQILLENKENGITVVSLQGRMDASTAPDFDEALRPELDKKTPYLVLNMAGLEYISSAGLRSILALVKNAKATQMQLAFCSIQPMVAEIFEVSGFTSMLNIYDTVDAAIMAKG